MIQGLAVLMVLSIHLVKFMTHEVADLEPMVDFVDSEEIRSSTGWEARYVCLIWLSIICMVPFDLRKIDSGLVASGQQSLIHRLLDIHKRYLGSTGKERDASSILVARLLSRFVQKMTVILCRKFQLMLLT
jgi:hypothetical protein